jgi:hypothetical protein
MNDYAITVKVVANVGSTTWKREKVDYDAYYSHNHYRDDKETQKLTAEDNGSCAAHCAEERCVDRTVNTEIK